MGEANTSLNSLAQIGRLIAVVLIGIFLVLVTR